MIATTEQRIPWLRGEHRSAGAAGAVAARDQPQLPRRPLPMPMSRARRIVLLMAAAGLLVAAVVMFLGPLSDRCGPVGDVKRCGEGPPEPSTPPDKPWTSAFESIVQTPVRTPVSGRVRAEESRRSTTTAHESSEDESEGSGSDGGDE